MYLAHFTEQEIQDTVAFYKTQSGQTVAAKMPKVMEGTTKVMEGLADSIMPEVQELVEKFINDIQAQRKSSQ